MVSSFFIQNQKTNTHRGTFCDIPKLFLAISLSSPISPKTWDSLFFAKRAKKVFSVAAFFNSVPDDTFVRPLST